MENLIYLLSLIPILYSLGGSDYCGTSVRKYGVPLVTSVALWSFWPLLLFIPLSLGYGIPEIYNGIVVDKGSSIGRLMYGVSKKWANLLTRLTVSVLLTVCLFAITYNPYVLLFIPWYLFWAVFNKSDDFEIGGLLVEEILIGIGLGVCLWPFK